MSTNRYNTRSRDVSEVKDKLKDKTKDKPKVGKKVTISIPEDDSSSDDEVISTPPPKKDNKKVTTSRKEKKVISPPPKKVTCPPVVKKTEKSRPSNIVTKKQKHNDYTDNEDSDEEKDNLATDKNYEEDEDEDDDEDDDIDIEYEDEDEEIDERGNIKGLIDYEDDNEDDNGDIIIDMSGENNPFNALFGSLFGGGEGGSGGKRDEYKKKIEDSKMNDKLKERMLEKLEKTQFGEKEVEWFDNLMKIPFGEFAPLPIDVKKNHNPNGSPHHEVVDYFTRLVSTLDKVVYGMHTVKEEIVNYVAQTLTTSTPAPRILALHGVAGVGKTKIIREGISKALARPMHSFSMGGIKDSSHFVGFDYTYYSSKYGAIVQCLMDSKVMNPVLFFDELDKISGSHEGEEVENLLIHFTDPEQNFDFKDKYFNEISIDLSKAIFIFSFNDINKINPILKDRLHIIKIKTPTAPEKLIIIKDYVVDELLKNIGISRSDFAISDEAIKYIVSTYSSSEGGVRQAKRCIETILLKINTIKLLGNSLKWTKDNFTGEECKLPIQITERNVSKFLKSHEDNDSHAYMSMYA